MFSFAAAAFLAAAAAACGSDHATSPDGSGGGPGTVPIVYTLTVDTTLTDSISATVATQLPVIVHLTKAGVGVAGGTVKWTATQGGGRLSADSSTTDANGTATVLWTLGDTAGYNTLSIAAFDATTAYYALGKAGTPSNLTRVTADSSVIVAGASLPIAVRATDRLGNGAGGADVEWSATGGQITFTSTPAGANGGASTVFTSPSTPGNYTITATLPGHASIIFKVTAL